MMGLFMVLAAMFYLNSSYAIYAIAAVCLIHVYLKSRFQGCSRWADISQAVVFKLSRHGLDSLRNGQVAHPVPPGP